MAQFVRVNGFKYDSKWAYLESLPHQVRLKVGSDDHYVHIWSNPADLSEGFGPVHPGHSQIEKNQIELLLPQFFQRQLAGIRWDSFLIEMSGLCTK